MADALSRVDAVCIEPEWSMEEIVMEQKKDPELLALCRELQKRKPKLDLFAPAEGLLSIDPTTDAIMYATRIVLPKSLRITALELMHDHGDTWERMQQYNECKIGSTGPHGEQKQNIGWNRV